MSDTTPNAEKARRIIQRLHLFNRKERDHLMKFALCEQPDNHPISLPLWRLISVEKDAQRPAPTNMFIGMDYHLNWLFAALTTADESWLADVERVNEWSDSDYLANTDHRVPIQGNQQDVDLLIAWIDECSGETLLQLVLVEAKLDGSWDSGQFKSKKQRMTLLKKEAEGLDLRFLRWRFLLLSPGDPPRTNEFDLEKISANEKWLLRDEKQLWHRLLPLNHDLVRVTRTGKVENSRSNNGVYSKWKTVVSKKSNRELIGRDKG